MSWSYEENVDNARTSMMSFRVYQEPENCDNKNVDKEEGKECSTAKKT